MKAIVVTSGPLQGQVYSLDKSVLIGRDGECDVQLMEPSASRRHASVFDGEGDTVRVRDLASHNGTWVDGVRITDRVLQPNQGFTIGKVTFEYMDLDPLQVQTDTTTGIIHFIGGPAAEETRTDALSPEDLQVLRELAARRTIPPESD